MRLPERLICALEARNAAARGEFSDGHLYGPTTRKVHRYVIEERICTRCGHNVRVTWTIPVDDDPPTLNTRGSDP